MFKNNLINLIDWEVEFCHPVNLFNQSCASISQCAWKVFEKKKQLRGQTYIFSDHFMYELEKVKFENPTLRAFWVSPTDTDIWQIWPMWYQFRHVLMVQMPCALELKPHLHNDNDLWKKNYHFTYWKLPYSFNIARWAIECRWAKSEDYSLTKRMLLTFKYRHNTVIMEI